VVILMTKESIFCSCFSVMGTLAEHLQLCTVGKALLLWLDLSTRLTHVNLKQCRPLVAKPSGIVKIWSNQKWV